MADISNIITVLGNQHRRKAEFISSLQKFFGMTSKKHLTYYELIKDELPLVTDYLSNIVQKGGPTKAWNPTLNPYNLQSRVLKARFFEVHLEENIEYVAQSALAEFQGQGTYTRPFTFEKIFIDKVLKQILQNLEQAIWKGVYNAAATPVGVADVMTIIDGIEQLVTSNIASCNVVTTGAVNATNAISSLDNIWGAVPEELKNEGAKMYVPPYVFRNYLLNQNSRNINYMNFWASTPSQQTDGDQTAYKPLYLDSSGGMCEIVQIKAKVGTNRIICDPAGVLCMGTDLFTEFGRLQFKDALDFKNVRIFCAGKIGVQALALQVGTLRYLTVSDVA